MPVLTDEELDAIIKVERGSGKLRLGVSPENIVLDGSLASIEWKLPSLGGTRAANRAHEHGLCRAAALLEESRRMLECLGRVGRL